MKAALPSAGRTIDVLVPGAMSFTRAALSSCAIENNQLAIDALETIRRVEVGEPVGEHYARRLNWLMLEMGDKPE